MSTITAIKLSGSTDGKGVKVTQTAIGSGDTIHTAHASSVDFITLFAVNEDTTARTLTIGWGGTTAVDNTITIVLPAQSGPIPIADRMPLTNSLVVKAAADTANKVAIYGMVSRVA